MARNLYGIGGSSLWLADENNLANSTVVSGLLPVSANKRYALVEHDTSLYLSVSDLSNQWAGENPDNADAHWGSFLWSSGTASSGKFWLVDADDPTMTSLVGSLHADLDSIACMASDGTTIYALNSIGRELWTVNTSNLLASVLVGVLPTGLTNPQGATWHDGNLYVLSNETGSSGLWRINTSNPSDETGVFGLVGTIVDGDAVGLASHDDTLYALIYGSNNDLWELDLSSIISEIISSTARGSAPSDSGITSLSSFDPDPPGDALLTVGSSFGTLSGTLRISAVSAGEALVKTTGSIGDISGSLSIQASDAGEAQVSTASIIGAFGSSLGLLASSPGRASITTDSSLGTLASSLSLRAILDLQLSDFDTTDLESDVLALLISTSNGGAVYADSDRGGTGSPLDGELGVSTTETIISRISILNSGTLLRLNHNNNPPSLPELELSSYFGSGGDGEDLTLTIQTLQGAVTKDASDFVSAGGGYINYNFQDSDDQAILQGIVTDTRFIIAYTRSVTTEASVSTSSDIGDISGSLKIRASSAGKARVETDSNVGTLQGSLGIQAISPGAVHPSITGSIGNVSGSLRVQASDAGKAEVSSSSDVGILDSTLRIQAKAPDIANITTDSSLGTLQGELRVRATTDLTLDAFNTANREIDVLALIRVNTGATWYADSDRGGTDTPVDGELGLSDTETVFSRIRRIALTSPDRTRINFNDSDNPSELTLSTYFNGDGSDLTLTIQTASGSVSQTISDAVGIGSSFIEFDFTNATDRTFLNAITDNDLVIIALWRTPRVAEVAFSSGLGDISGELSIQATEADTISISSESTLGTITGALRVLATDAGSARVSSVSTLGTLDSSLSIRAASADESYISINPSLGLFNSTLRIRAEAPGTARVSSDSSIGLLSGSLSIRALFAGDAQIRTQGTLGTLNSTLSLRAIAPTFARVETDSTLGTLTATLSLKADDNVKTQATEVTEIYLNGRSEYDPKYLSNLASLGTKLDVDFRSFRWRNSPKSRTQTLRFYAYSPTTPGQYHILSGNTIYMYERGNAKPSFGGSVETAIENEYVPNRFQYQVTCTDWITWLDHNRFVHTFESKPASGMIDEMIERLKVELDPGSPTFYYGFTTDNVIEGGPDIEQQEIDRTRSPSSFLQFLANTLGWLWWIDPERDIHFVPNFIGEAPDPFIDWEDQPIGDADLDGDSPPYWKLQITETRKDVRDRLSIRDFSRESDDKTIQIEIGNDKKTFFPMYAPPSSLESFTAAYRQVTEDGTPGPWNPYTVLEDGVHGLGGDGNEGFFLCLWNQGVRIEPAPESDTENGNIEIMMEYSASQPSFFQIDEADAQEVMMDREGEGTGIYEEVISMPDLQVKDENALEERADTFFRRQAYPHRYGTFTTYRNGWQPGQTFILCSRHRQGGTPANPYEERYFVQTVNKRILVPYDEKGIDLVETNIEYADDFWGGP